jgi:hypothetical protein
VVVALAALVQAAPIGAVERVNDQFIDVQAGSGVDFVHSFGDAEMSNLVESSGFGVCLFDFDGDELLDIYLVNGSSVAGVSDPVTEQDGPALTNRLYKNLGSWQFADATASTGVGDTGFGMGCVAGDLDNDGDKDLIVTNYGPDRWYRNDGPSSGGAVTFSDQTPPMVRSDASWSLGATLADFDRDGLLDVYTGKYVQFDPEYRAFYVANRFPGPLAYPGEQDRLYRNQGEWQFEDLTQSAGIANPEGRAMGVGALDYDVDGWIDIFVANDAMANSLYRNLGDGRFEESALITGLAFGENGDATAAMGIDFADFNRDGLLDLVVPDMTFFALYEGQKEGLFRDVSRVVGLASVAAQYVGWSGHFLDYDNDGLVDLFITTGDLHDWEPMGDLILRGNAAGRFEDAARDAGRYFLGETMGRGAAIGDIDNDGDVDVVLNRLGDRPVLLQNQNVVPNHWLSLQLVGRRSNRDGVGARVTMQTGQGTQVAIAKSGSGYLGSSDPRIHFGVGGETRIDRIQILWPDGNKQVLEDLPVDEFRIVEEPR